MNLHPLVCIVTPYYNALPFARDFILMLLSQEYLDWQCIMVDDSSSDGSTQALKAYAASDSRFVFLSTSSPDGRPLGPAAARNVALRHCVGSLVAFCDIDDLWHPSKLRHQVRFHVSNKLDISVTAYLRFETTSSKNRMTAYLPPHSIHGNQIYLSNPIPMLTTLIDTSKLPVVFKLSRHEDYLLWLDIFSSQQSVSYACLPEVLAFYRSHPESLSSNKLISPIWCFSVFRNHGLSVLSSICALVLWFYGHLIRRYMYLLKRTSGVPFTVDQLMDLPPLRMQRGVLSLK